MEIANKKEIEHSGRDYMKLCMTMMLVAACGLTHAAELSNTWTLQAHGTIDSGFDSEGIFGEAGQDLAGLEMTQTIIASVDPGNYDNAWNDSNYRFLAGMHSPFYVSVTVNGRTFAMSPTLALSGEQALVSGLRDGASYGYNYDQVATDANGSTEDGQKLSAGINIGSTTKGFVPALDFHQSMTLDLTDQVTGRAHFSYSKSAPYYPTFFYASLDAVSVNPVETQVPEPGPVALLAIGFSALLATCRRKHALTTRQRR